MSQPLPSYSPPPAIDPTATVLQLEQNMIRLHKRRAASQWLLVAGGLLGLLGTVLTQLLGGLLFVLCFSVPGLVLMLTFLGMHNRTNRELAATQPALEVAVHQLTGGNGLPQGFYAVVVTTLPAERSKRNRIAVFLSRNTSPLEPQEAMQAMQNQPVPFTVLRAASAGYAAYLRDQLQAKGATVELHG
ncbi:MAG: hypothetical protein GYB65_24305 [Chloroflexi bacterium]|nr:hypothetical protein [Chloroflexota bacterium]